MRSRRRTETTIETQEFWIIRSRRVDRERCADCADCAGMLTPEEAARVVGVSLRAIYRLVEAGRLHFRETPEGGLFVCPASLPADPG